MAKLKWAKFSDFFSSHMANIKEIIRHSSHQTFYISHHG